LDDLSINGSDEDTPADARAGFVNAAYEAGLSVSDNDNI